FTDGIQHHRVVEFGGHFTNDVNAFRLELFQVRQFVEHGFSRSQGWVAYGPWTMAHSSTAHLLLGAALRSKRSRVMLEKSTLESPDRTSSERVVTVDEQVLDGETPRQIVAQRLHPITLGGMVPGRDEGHAVFLRTVEGLLGGFPGQIQVNSGGNRLVDVTLAAAGAPADPSHHASPLNQQRFATEHLVHPARKITGTDRF